MIIIHEAKRQFSILQRSRPRYVLYTLIGAFLISYGWFFARNGQITDFELSLFRALNNLPSAIGWAFLLITIFGSIGIAWVISIVALFRRRYAFFAQVFLASTAAWFGAKFVKSFDIRQRPYDILQNVHVIDIRDTAVGYPSGHMAVATALALVIAPRLGANGRRILYIAVFLVGVSRVVVGMHAPLDILGGFGVGLIAGSIINFLTGTPSRRFLASDIAAALKMNGLRATGIHSASVDARGSAPYFGEYAGDPIFIKIVDSDNTIADWLFKFTRRILYRRLEDELPYINAKSALEHEAFVAMLARESGIKTPKILGVYHIAGPSWAMVQQGVKGVSLDKIDPETITDKQLAEVWQLVAQLHENRIAHRDLRTANILRADDGALWLIDFGFAENATSQQGIVRDCVEMLGSMTCIVGAERAVKAARTHLSLAQLASILPFVQYSVLSGATTKSLKKYPGNIIALRQELNRVTHQKATSKIAKISRLNGRAIFFMVVFVLLLVAVVPRIGQLQAGVTAAKGADWQWLVVALGAAVMTYFASAFTYVVLAKFPIRYMITLGVQVAASFANRLIPSGIGGLGLNVDYLIKNGHKPAEAGSVTAVNSAAAFVSYVILLFIALTVSNTSIFELLSGKSLPYWAFPVAGVVLLMIGFVIYKWEKARTKIVRLAKDMWADILEYRHEPFRLVLAVLGASFVTIFYVGALFACAHAIGLDLTLLDAFVAYTIGTLVGAAIPTPGGLGGVEAGLYAGFVALSYDSALAFTTIIIYRLFTFWLPILPGYLVFWQFQKRKII